MKRCLAGLCLLLMLLTACTARPSQTPVTAKDDAARRLAELGVDALITDVPDRIAEAVRAPRY